MLRRASLALLGLLALGSPAAAQDPLGWNAERALDLISRARVRRELPRGDSTLQNYQARANGYVYFYLDRLETNERTLVKVDQIALDLFWKRPNVTKQHIIGLRDVNRLPNRMQYHLDHLTVVQNGFGDLIRIGDGDEVRDVPHPAARGSDTIYDYRLADSVTLQLGGDQAEVRVYELQVRPRRTDRSAFIGSVFIDRGSADIVRMTFTFTPASYVDRRLDYINISLDNGLFGGAYWLPHEQSVEIRRQIPELDFAAGAVIKGRLTVTNYRFNEPIADSVFYGRPVTAAPESARKAFPFPEDVYAGVQLEGLGPPPQMEDLRARAAALVRERRLSGLPAWRLYIPNASSVLRHTNAEGWYGGLGVTYAPEPKFRADFTGGYAFGIERPEATMALRNRTPDVETTLRAYYNEPRDIGPIQGMPGVLNTFASGFGDTDYTNTYFTRGTSLRITHKPPSGWEPFVGLSYEQHRGDIAANGTAFHGTVGLARTLSDRGTFNWSATTAMSFVHFASQNFMRGEARAEVQQSSADLRTSVTTTFHAGWNSTSSVPPQYRFLLGGRETLPGYSYREFSESSYALARVELARTLVQPWIRARLLGNAAIGDGSQVRASVGVGLSLLWDALRVDVVKGRRWQTLVSIKPEFWDML